MRPDLHRRPAIRIDGVGVHRELVHENPLVVRIAERHPSSLAIQTDFAELGGVLDPQQAWRVGSPLSVVRWPVLHGVAVRRSARRVDGHGYPAAGAYFPSRI